MRQIRPAASPQHLHSPGCSALASKEHVAHVCFWSEMLSLTEIFSVGVLLNYPSGGTPAASKRSQSAAGVPCTIHFDDHFWPRGALAHCAAPSVPATHSCSVCATVCGIYLASSGHHILGHGVGRRPRIWSSKPPLWGDCRPLRNRCVNTCLRALAMYSLSALRMHGVGGVVRQHGYRPSGTFRFLHRLHICLVTHSGLRTVTLCCVVCVSVFCDWE